MMYALVTDNTIHATGRLPNSARRLDTAAWVMGLATAPVELQQATGWYEVADTPRPADTDTHTHDRSVELLFDVPTVTWTQRPWTVDELAARSATTNDTTLRNRAALALDINATFLARQSPTNAQVVAQVQTLTRECSALIRLAIGALDSTAGT